MRAVQQVPLEVLTYLASWSATRPTLEERLGTGQTVLHLLRLRDPKLVLTLTKPARKGAAHA